jgi:hypothetical protein
MRLDKVNKCHNKEAPSFIVAPDKNDSYEVLENHIREIAVRVLLSLAAVAPPLRQGWP